MPRGRTSSSWTLNQRAIQSKKMQEHYLKHPEARKAISERVKRNHIEHPERYRGQKRSEESKKLISEKIKEAMNRPEVKKRMREGAQRRRNRPGERGLKSARMKKYYIEHPEAKEMMGIRVLNRFARMTSEEKHLYALRARMGIKVISKGEKALYETIRQHYPTAKSSQWIAGYQIIGYQADIILPEYKINVEYDGIYWHRNAEKDKARDEVLQKLGWTILRVKEKEPFDINVLHNLVGLERGGIK